jgi:hypothetical protein
MLQYFMSQHNLSKFSKAFNEAMKRWNEIQRKKIMGKGNIGPLNSSIHIKFIGKDIEVVWRGVKLGLNI